MARGQFLYLILLVSTLPKLSRCSPTHQWPLTQHNILWDRKEKTTANSAFVYGNICPLLKSDSLLGDGSFYYDGGEASVADFGVQVEKNDNKEKYTFTMWLKPDNQTSTGEIFEYKSKLTSNNRVTSARGEMVNGKVKFTVARSSGDIGSVTSSDGLDASKFNSVLLSMDKKDDNMRMYVTVNNGAEVYDDLENWRDRSKLQIGGTWRLGEFFERSGTRYVGKINCITFFEDKIGTDKENEYGKEHCIKEWNDQSGSTCSFATTTTTTTTTTTPTTTTPTTTTTTSTTTTPTTTTTTSTTTTPTTTPTTTTTTTPTTTTTTPTTTTPTTTPTTTTTTPTTTTPTTATTTPTTTTQTTTTPTTTTTAPTTTSATTTTTSAATTTTPPTTTTPTYLPVNLWPLDNVTRGYDVITGSSPLTSQETLACLRTETCPADTTLSLKNDVLFFDGTLSSAVEMEVNRSALDDDFTVVVYVRPQQPPEGLVWSYAAPGESDGLSRIEVSLHSNGSLMTTLWVSGAQASCATMKSAGVFDASSDFTRVTVGRKPSAIMLQVGDDVWVDSADSCPRSPGSSGQGSLKVGGRSEGESAGYRGHVVCMAVFSQYVSTVDDVQLLSQCGVYDPAPYLSVDTCDTPADIRTERFKLVKPNAQPALTTLPPMTSLLTSSVFKCAGHCMQTTHCKSFTLSKGNGVCRLYDVVTFAALESSDDSHYYEIKQRSE